jgi:hypothetical protein
MFIRDSNKCNLKLVLVPWAVRQVEFSSRDNHCCFAGQWINRLSITTVGCRLRKISKLAVMHAIRAKPERGDTEADQHNCGATIPIRNPCM